MLEPHSIRSNPIYAPKGSDIQSISTNRIITLLFCLQLAGTMRAMDPGDGFTPGGQLPLPHQCCCRRPASIGEALFSSSPITSILFCMIVYAALLIHQSKLPARSLRGVADHVPNSSQREEEDPNAGAAPGPDPDAASDTE